MKNLVIAVLVVIGSIMSIKADPSEKLIDALVKVESNGRSNVVGDNGNAVGCLQIWKCVVDDVNEYNRIKKVSTRYTYDDRYDVVKSRAMCRTYLLRYGGKNASDEKYARIWNGGPSGWKKGTSVSSIRRYENTTKYWNKVRLHIQFIDICIYFV